MIAIRELTEPDRAAFETLIAENWQATWNATLTHEIVKWRYYARPDEATTWLAFDDRQCIAMLDSVVRPYQLDGRPLRVRETADWYCKPSYRPYGVGMWLLRTAMRRAEPIVVLNGTEDNVAILSRLHWLDLPSATSYVLPVTVRGLTGNMMRKTWPRQEATARFVPRLPLKSLHQIDAPRGRAAVQMIDDPNRISPTASGLIQLIGPQHLAWMLAIPQMLAKAVGMMFVINDKPVGLSLSQIEPTAYGYDGKIVHLQCRDDAVLPWMISETARMLIDHEVGFIRCYVSTPAKMQAIEQVGFVKSKDVQCHWWPGQADIVPPRIDVHYLRGDDAMPFHALRGRYIR